MDLPIQPDFPVVESVKHNTLVSTFENGVEQRRSKWSLPIREFDLTFKTRSQTEYNLMVAFVKAKLGALTSFTFDNPNDSTTYTVRFKEDSFRASLRAYQIYDMDCVLVEVK